MLFVAKSKHLLERYLVKVFCSIYVIAKKRKIILFYSYNKQRAIDHEGWAVGVAALWGGIAPNAWIENGIISRQPHRRICGK